MESDITFEKISSINALESQHVYDLSIEGTQNFIANDIIAHNTARYFRYLAKFNTSNANLTPILNDVTINFTGIFTNNFGIYNYSFTAPTAAATYTLKVNATSSNISGEALQSFSVEANSAPNAPIVNSPPNGSNFSRSYVLLNITISDNNTFAQTFRCYFYGDNASTAPTVIINTSNPVTVNGTIVTFNWTNLNSSTWYWKAQCQDDSLNGSNSSVNQFVVDVTPPYFQSTAINVTPRFNESVQISTNVTDLNGLSMAIFAWNDTSTGKWINVSNSSVLPSTQTSLNYTVNQTVNKTRGNVIGWQFYANDTFGNWNYSTLQTFTVANTVPNNATILIPSNNEYTNAQPLQLNVTFSSDIDNDTINITYYINGKLNQTSLFNTTFNASDGNFTLNVSLFDGTGYSANATVNFTIDTLNPSVNFTATLSNQSFVNQNYITTNITLNETNFANVTFFLWNGTGTIRLYNETNFTSQTLFVNFTDLSKNEISYLINVTARDKASNINSTETRNITLDAMNPSINFTSPTPANNSRAVGNTNNRRVINITMRDVSIGSCVLQSFNGTDNATNFTMQVQGLNCNVTIATIDGYNYTLKAFVNDTALNSNSTENWTFRENSAPEIPTLNAPANNSRQIITSITLNYTTNDNDTDAVNYIVYFDTNTNPVTQVYRGTSKTFIVSTTRGTTYYWKVQADDTFENSSNSTIRQFTVNTQPNASFIITPNLTGINLKGGQTYNVSWINQSDPDGDAITITLYYSTDSGLTYSNLIASGLTNNGSYPWTVPSINSNKARIKSVSNDSFEFTEDTSDNDFTIDSSAPTITLDNPPNQSSFNNGTFINLTITDNLVAGLNVTWNNGTLNAPNRTDFNGTYDINTTGWGVGEVNITVYANDSVGNSITANFRFNVTDLQAVVTYNTPTPNQIIRATFRVNVSSTSQLDDVGFVNFTYDGATQNFTMTQAGTNYFYDFDTTTVADRQRKLYVYGNDSTGRVVRADIFATIDNTAPAIRLDSPLNDTWRNASVTFVYVPNDVTTNIVNCSLIINNTINQSNASISESIENLFKNVAIGDGIYIWDVNCTDSIGNNGSNGTPRLLKIDTIAPVITLIDPPNDTSIRGNKTINFSITDAGSNVNNVTWSSNYLVEQTNFIGAYGINTSLFPEGKTNITIVANDSAGNKITMLFTFTIDLTPPLVTMNKPTPRQVVRGIFRVNVSATDALSNVSGLTFAFNGSQNFTMTRVGPEVTSDYFFDWNTTNASDKEYTLKIYGNDTAANIKFESRLAIVDNTAPAIRLDFPVNNTWNKTALVSFTFAVFELNSLNNCTLLVNGSVNATSQASAMTKNATNSFSVNLSDGNYRWTVNCSDEAVDANGTRNIGTNSTELLISVDATTPQISFVSPSTEANDSHFARNYTSINVTITEVNFANVTFYLYNQTVLINETNFTTTTYFINFTSLNISDLFFFNVTVRDRAGNINSTETRQISLNARAPSARRFIITDAAGASIASIDDKGDMYLLGNKSQALTSITPTTSSFIVQNSSANAIAYINSTGYLFLRGVMTEDAGITLNGTNLEIRDSSDRVVAIIDSQGNLKLIGLLVEKYSNP